MKFDYIEPEEETRECVAYMTHMDCEPDKPILCIHNTDYTNPSGLQASLWMYYDGETQLGKWEPELATKKFYKGDTVSITF